jgi:hypothetical protein
MNAPRRRVGAHPRLRAFRVVVSVAVLLAIDGCAPGSRQRPRSSIAETASATSSPAATSSPSPSDAAAYPNLSSFSDPFDRIAYRLAYSDCRILGVVRAAEAFGGDADDPSSVANAYAVNSFPTLRERRGASSRGCLDGFDQVT